MEAYDFPVWLIKAHRATCREFGFKWEPCYVQSVAEDEEDDCETSSDDGDVGFTSMIPDMKPVLIEFVRLLSDGRVILAQIVFIAPPGFVKDIGKRAFVINEFACGAGFANSISGQMEQLLLVLNSKAAKVDFGTSSGINPRIIVNMCKNLV